ncbi:RloB domain-containing protein [Marinifilum sp. D737]|uniref:RloB domain-containing protein n=1 Tax=Marinifilum sp. D737 TaxID=2969628 RepID=UPI0022751B42|nr:RloB domain-containing protein [Marinifilum sp. D737]MCY1633918.1 RloB family protein [Marinifilum sp. D737]
MARQNIRKRKLRKGIAVLGDGRTEQYYLQHLKQIKGYKYAIKPSLFDCINLKQAEDIIDDLIDNEYGLIIFFTDYDTIINQGRQADFDALRKKYKGSTQVIICESMPSIEYWFLLHFVKTTREFINADQVHRELLKHLGSYSKKIKELGKPEWVKELCDNNRMENAILNATDILQQKLENEGGNHFPFTKAHKGINKFEE